MIGSYLHRYAYPEWYAEHLERGRELTGQHSHRSGPVGCLQLRGEYLYAAEGPDGMRIYDVAQVGNKDWSQRIRTAPFSPLGQNLAIPSANATCARLRPFSSWPA